MPSKFNLSVILIALLTLDPTSSMCPCEKHNHHRPRLMGKVEPQIPKPVLQSTQTRLRLMSEAEPQIPKPVLQNVQNNNIGTVY